MYVRPSPVFPDKRVVLVGADKFEKACVGDIDLSAEGWFDYSYCTANGDDLPKLSGAANYSVSPGK